MTEKQTDVKPALKDVLNVRVDARLAAEVDRIAGLQETSASEAARKLLQYGIEVARKLEADDLMRPYWNDPSGDHRNEHEQRLVRVEEITAQWRWEVDEEPW
jgi:hypothetical protein